MQQKKLSSRFYSLVKSALMTAVLPVFLVYILMAKPDYKIMNGLAHVVLPAANWVGDGITWPVRAIGNAIDGIRELSKLRSENEELRARLNDAVHNQNECTIATIENQRLTRELDIVRAKPQRVIIAGITYDNSAFHHNTFLINKGVDSGIEPGMAVVSFENVLVGIVSDVAPHFAKVRALTDSKSNIPVRIAGSEVYGFLQGTGSDVPRMGFFSDPEFQATQGLKLVTSSIRGALPDGIMVGEMMGPTDTQVLHPRRISNVMILKFDDKDKYK